MQRAAIDFSFMFINYGLPLIIVWRIWASFSKRRKQKEVERLKEPPAWMKSEDTQ